MKFPVRRIVCAFSVFASFAAQAQEWPSKPVRVILSLGGGAEPLMRAAGEKLTEALGQPFVVELQGGAGGQIGAEMVARSAPDGHTLLLTSANTHVHRKVVVKNVPYDPIADFTPVAKVADTILCIAVSREFPAQSLQQLIDYAKANPGKLSYSTSGIGTGHHINAAQLEYRAGIDMVHVPYKTGQQQMIDLLANRVPIAFTVTATALPYMQAGKARIIGIIGPRRFASLPDVPTVQERVKGYESLPGWLAFFGPAGIPQPLVARMQGEIFKVFQLPDIRAKWDAAGFVVDLAPADALGAMLKRQLGIVTEIVKQAHIEQE